MNNIFVSCKLSDGAQLPRYQTEGAVGLDVHALGINGYMFWPNVNAEGKDEYILHSMTGVLVSTGISLAIPVGWEAQVRPRSSLFARGIHCALGTIDSDYRGEVKVGLMNLSGEPYHLLKGDRIAQLVFAPVARAVLNVVETLDETKRGERGFGSTGK